MESCIARLKELVAFPRNLVKVKGKADRGVGMLVGLSTKSQIRYLSMLYSSLRYLRREGIHHDRYVLSYRLSA